MTTHINLAEELAKHKLTRLILNATEVNGKVKEWQAIHDAVQNILKIYKSHIIESQDTKLALAISPLMADAPWNLSYAQLRAVVQNFRGNTPTIRLADATKTPQTIRHPRVENQRTPHCFGQTTERITTPTKHVHAGNLLKPKKPVPISGTLDSNHHKAPLGVAVHVESGIRPFRRLGMDDDDESPNTIPIPNRITQDGRAEMPTGLPTPQGPKKSEARGRLMQGKPKKVFDTDDSSSSGEEKPGFNKQHIGKRCRTSSDTSSDVVPNPNNAKLHQADDNIRAPFPCDQCKKAGLECFTFPKVLRRPVRRVCTRCHKQKKGCSFNSSFTRGSKKKNEEPLSNMEENIVKDNFKLTCQIPRTVRVMDRAPKCGPPSNHAKKAQEPARGDVTKRVTEVENMVSSLQDQVQIIREQVVTMDSRIEDVYEGTKSMTRVMKRFETRSEQSNKIIEKLVERVEQL